MNRHYMLEALLLSSGKRLPSAYQEVEFVYPFEVGTNQLGFGIIWSDIKRIKCGLRSPSTATNTMLFNTGDRQNPWIAISRQNGVNIISSKPSLSSLTDMTKKDLDIVLSTSSQANITTRGWGDAWDKRIEYYYVEFYDANDELLGNFIPCYRKSDGLCGFYDLITKTFSGSSHFAKGPDIGSDSIEGNALSLAPDNTITGNTLNINNGDTIVGNTLNI